MRNDYLCKKKMKKSLIIKFNYDIVGYMMLLSIFYSIIIPSLLWWFNITIQPFIFPLAVLISILHFCNYKLPIKESILFLLLLVLSIQLNLIIPDMSWDGQAYHQPMVYALANGWNPIANSHNPIINDLWNMNIWIDHYLKGMEISAATIFSMTGQLETGKTVNMMLLFSVLMISLYNFKKSNLLLSLPKVILYAFVIACPMVFINFGFTFYIDVATYYLVVWILIVFNLLSKDNHTIFTWYLLFIIVSLSACVKLNTFFWICYGIAFYCIYLLYRKEYQKLTKIFSVSILSVIFVIVTVDFNPIITNYFDHHNPVYPIGTKEAVDINTNAMPNMLKDKNRIFQVLISIFSRPNDNMETPYLNPYHISYRYNIRSLGYGAKLGGGGLFFIEVFIFSIILFIISRKGKYKITVSFVSFLLLSTLFILPFGSNYRYVPFISLLPILLLLYTEKVGLKYTYANKLRILCIILLLLNNLISIPFFLKNTYLSARSQKEAINYIINSKSHNSYHSKNWSFNYKLYGNHIIDKEIFSDNNDNYIPISDQFGPPIYLNKEYYVKKMHRN